MPKRKSPKTNSSLSKEEATPNKSAILRVVKQKSTATDDNNSAQAESASTELPIENQPVRNKPAYKKLSTATNSSGQTFTVKEKIEVSTGNFGTQTVFIISLYSAADGSIWAYYHPIDTNQRQLWKRGCCRIENLRKLDSNSCPA